MSDFIGDLATAYQTPEAAANAGYQVPASFGANALATIESGTLASLGEAAARGRFAGSSAFDQGMAQLEAQSGAPDQPLLAPAPAPAETPIMAADEINERYGPIGPDGKHVSIADQPMPQGLAQLIGQQKAAAMERDGVMARFAAAHSWPVTLAAGALASLADPANLAVNFIPPLGEARLAGALARAGITGFAGRTAARLGAGAVTGGLTQVPLTALQMGLAPEEARDFSIGDALRDIAYGAAGYAALHAVGGAIGDVLPSRSPTPAVTSAESGIAGTGEPAPLEAAAPVPAMRDLAAPIVTADAETTRGAMSAATAQLADGRPVDVAPFFYPPPQTDTALGSAVPLPVPEREQLLAQQDALRAQLAANPEDHPTVAAFDRQLDAMRAARLDAVPAGRPALAAQIARTEELRQAALDQANTGAGAARQQLLQLDYRLRDLAYGDVSPVADFAMRQQQLYRDGFAAGVPDDELAATEQAVYAPQTEAAAPSAADASGAPEAIPATEAAQTAEQARPAPPPAPARAVEAAATPTPAAAPIAGPLPNAVRAFRPDELTVDAKRFQFKEGGDQAGVTGRLAGVETWDPIKAGMTVVYEDADGRHYIADGHQRLGLAQRIAAADPAQKPMLNAYVLRAADGIRDSDARLAAAAKNIAEGTGSAVDAAKVLRERPDLIRELPPRSELVRQAKGLANLDDEAFGLVVNDVVPPQYAAIVGRLAPEDARMQRALLELVHKTEPENAVQAEAIVRQGLAAGAHVETQGELFGAREIASSLYLDRAKILDRALKQLRRDRRVFDAVVSERDIVEQLGNVLAHDENTRRAATDAHAIQIIQTLASRKGPVSDALGDAARAARDTGNYAGAARDFVGALRRQVASGDLARLADGGRGGALADRAEDARLSEPAAEQAARVAPPAAAPRAAAEAKDIIDKTAQGDQRAMPGMERSAVQAAAAREAEGRGMLAPDKPQEEPGGLFAPPEAPQAGLFDRDAELAEAERRAAASGAELSPEEAATGPALDAAKDRAAAIAEAQACLAEGGQ